MHIIKLKLISDYLFFSILKVIGIYSKIEVSCFLTTQISTFENHIVFPRPIGLCSFAFLRSQGKSIKILSLVGHGIYLPCGYGYDRLLQSRLRVSKRMRRIAHSGKVI